MDYLFFFNRIRNRYFMLLGLSFFDAINHSLTTTSTGGFSTKQAKYSCFSESIGGSCNCNLYVFSRNQFYHDIFWIKNEV